MYYIGLFSNVQLEYLKLVEYVKTINMVKFNCSKNYLPANLSHCGKVQNKVIKFWLIRMLILRY